MDDAPRQIGPYEIRGVIGRGGMGVVYLARDERLHRDVAIKALDPALARDPARIAQFRREARVVAQLSHPNIVQIHQMLEQEGRTFLVLEHVPGVSLAQLLDDEDPPDVARALRVGAQIACALDAAHAIGVCHRDLKPGNVRLRDDGVVKVLDFGLAGVGAEPDGADAPRRAGGTPGYMAPEQIRAEPADARADIFALGCVLFECLTGARAFDGEDVAETVRATLEDEPDWGALPPAMPDGTEALLRACVAKAPGNRPASMRAVARALDAALGRRRRAPDTPPEHAGSLAGMPRRRTSFVGRRGLLERLVQTIDTTRLVTLTGPGGSGKTRLASEVAPRMVARFPDGVHWIELASIRDERFVPALVARSLGAEERPDATAAEAVAAGLAGRRVLLVLDNCEHVLAAATRLADELLLGAPGLHVLATSRQRLGVHGERLFPIAGLTVPERDDDVAGRAEAVALFAERARLADPGFTLTPENAPAVARLCRRLDGIPLAIEFAAARVRTLSPEQIERRLDDRFRLLVADTHGTPERFRTLRAAVDWSHDLLSEAERRLLARLSVFAGGWSLEAAHAVCGPGGGDGGVDLDEFAVLDLLTGLADKSLVLVERRRSTPARYALLETIREYAAEKLGASGEEPEIVDRHLAYCVALASEAETRFTRADQAEWLGRVELEHENILAALARNDATPRHVADACRLCGAVLKFWQLHGHFRTGLEACSRLLAEPNLPRGTPEHAAVLQTAATMAMKLGDLALTSGHAADALRVARSLGDDRAAARALNSLGNAAYFERRFDDAERFHAESLEINRRSGSLDGVGASLNNLANIALDRDRPREATGLYERALEINRRAGNAASQAVNLFNLAVLAFRDDDLDRARRLLHESLALREGIDDRFGVAEVLAQLARVSVREGHPPAARAALRESLRLRHELGDRMGLCDSLDALAVLAADVGEHERAAALLGAASNLRDETGATRAVWEQTDLDRDLIPARSALGDDAFGAHEREGAERDLDDLVPDLLAWLEDRRAPTPLHDSRPTL
jgi:serine/threonine-protein kinase PknK